MHWSFCAVRGVRNLIVSFFIMTQCQSVVRGLPSERAFHSPNRQRSPPPTLCNTRFELVLKIACGLSQRWSDIFDR